MKTLFTCFSFFLFTLSTTASSFDTLVREVDMDIRGYVRRGDVLVPPSCSTRKTHPACNIKFPSSSGNSPLKVSTISRSGSDAERTSASSSSITSDYANAGTPTSSSQISSPTNNSNVGATVNSATSGTGEITPVGGGNSAIKVDSVPAPLDGTTKAKRSSHLSSHSSEEVTVIETHTVTSIETDYVGFDWSQWSDLCGLDEGDFSCSSWGGYEWDSAFEADADVCLQQKFSDIMITHAKRFGGGHRQALIDQVLKYRRHPRKVVKVLGVYPSTPYCLEEPYNSELYDVWNSQLEGVDFGIYGGPNYNLKVFGDEGTCPLGFKSDIESCGCIADVSFKKHRKSHKGHKKTREHRSSSSHLH